MPVRYEGLPTRLTLLARADARPRSAPAPLARTNGRTVREHSRHRAIVLPCPREMQCLLALSPPRTRRQWYTRDPFRRDAEELRRPREM